MEHLRPAFGALFAIAIALAGCGREPPASGDLPELPPRQRDGPPLVVVGIDGAEWSVIHRLWDQGRLENLKRLADEGTWTELGTDYGASPVIWTTIATGRAPSVHGITDFVVTTENGAVPVSSSIRRVPALWNMASRARLRTAVLGWWASWPAEAISGVEVTDRAHLPIEHIVYPESYSTAFEREKEKALHEHPGLGGGLTTPDVWMEDGAARDRIMAHEARRLVGAGFDLFLVYFRSVDIASHRYWKLLEPERYPSVTEEELEAGRDVIPTVYEATDAVLGELLAACPEGTNVFVVSDHGFVAGPEEHFVFLDVDRLLEELGYLVREGDAVDFTKSLAYSVDSAGHDRVKRIRLSLKGREPGGKVPRADARKVLDDLARDLASVTYANGIPALMPRREGLPPDVDLVVEVNVTEPTLELRFEGKGLDDVVRYVNTISGTHNARTQGIFIAKGPDLVPGASADGITILDLAPTLLYALGLPVGADFPGRAWEELFTESFRSRHPLREIPTWGTMETWGVATSPVDERILEELRALGYL